jgi:hypothetical protein
VLGLKYGTLRLVEHDARWIEPFPSERALLLEALDGLSCAVEHIGSTAVPSLPVSPVATSSYAPSATFAAIRQRSEVLHEGQGRDGGSPAPSGERVTFDARTPVAENLPE